MLFKKDFEIDEVSESIRLMNFRRAVRAVILKNDKILMVHSKNNDYKFPGGGVKKNEDKIIALKREIEEETGYVCKSVGKCIGIVSEKSKDRYYSNRIFKMISYYYIVEVYDIRTEQKLDDYEKQLEFKPVWMDINETIINNTSIMKKAPENMPNWIQRETYVLDEIEKCIKNGLI